MDGVVHINSKGEFIFKSVQHNSEKRSSATYLIACDKNLKNYIENAYDTHLHLKNLNEQFWISIEGKYLTDNRINENDSTSFLFNFISLIDPIKL